MSKIFNCYYVNYTAVDCVQIIKRVLIYCHQSDSYFIDKLGLYRTVLVLKCAFQGPVGVFFSGYA